MFTSYWKVLLPPTLSDPLDHPIQCAQLLTGMFQGEQTAPPSTYPLAYVQTLSRTGKYVYKSAKLAK